MKRNNYICYDQNTKIIWGLGQSPDEAMRDGLHYTHNCADFGLEDIQRLKLETCPCSKQLYEEVEVAGGDFKDWYIKDGIADLKYGY